MDSSKIARYGFSSWCEFSLTNKQEVLEKAGNQIGNYVIRYGKGNFCRFRGYSDILYIGKSTDDQHGMRTRVSSYFKPGSTQWTNKRTHSFLEKQLPMEISFKIHPNPKEFETQLLEQYLNDHDELPPFNRTQ